MKIKKLNRLGSLLLALTMLAQTLYPVLAYAMEDTDTRIQGLEELKEDKKEVTIDLDPSILEKEGLLPLILKTRTQDPLAKDEEVKKTSLIYKTDLVLDEKILEDLKTIGFQLEGPDMPGQDLGEEGKEEAQPIILNEESQASEPADLIQETEDPGQVEDPNLETQTTEDLETSEASQDYLEFKPGQDIVLPASQPIDYGQDFTYLRLALSKEAEDEIIKILKEGQANEKVLANLKEKIDLGIDLREEEVRKLLILENMTYEEVAKETLKESQESKENKGIKVLKSLVAPKEEQEEDPLNSKKESYLGLKMTFQNPNPILDSDLVALTSEGAKALVDDGDIKTLYKDLEDKAREEELNLSKDQELKEKEKTETPLEGLNKEDSEKDQDPNTETEITDQVTENTENLEDPSQEDTIGEILENLELDGQPLIKPLDQASPEENENPDLSPTMALGLFSLKARAGGSPDLAYNISGSLRVTGKAIKPGDKQVLKISPYLIMAEGTPIKALTMKVGETEVPVAEGIYDGTNKTITYTYNENISNLTDNQTYQIDLNQDFIIDTSTTSPGGTYYIENYFNGNVIGSQIINLPKEPDQGSFEPIYGNPLYYFDPTGGNDISLSAVGSPVVTNGNLESINWEITINSLDGKPLSNSGLITNFSFVEGSGVGAIDNFQVNGGPANLGDNFSPENSEFLMNSSYNYTSGNTTQEKITFTTTVTDKQESYSLDLSSMLKNKDAKPIGAKRLIVPGYTDNRDLTEKPSSVYMNNRTTIYGQYTSPTEARWVVTDEVSSGDLVSLPLATRKISDNQSIKSVEAAYYKLNEETGKLEKVGEQEFNTPTPNIPSSGTYPEGKQPPGTIAVYEIKTEFEETGAGQIYSLGSGKLDPWIGDIPVKTRWSNESTTYPAPEHTITATPDNDGNPIVHKVPAGDGSKELIDATIKNVPFYTYNADTREIKKINYDLTQQLPGPETKNGVQLSYYHNIMGVDDTGAPVFINSIGISEKVESKTANLTINKQDEKGNQLEGATFTITGVVNDGSLSSFKREITTGPDGKITLSELKPGSYNIVESVAPEGYSKSMTTHRIEVATNGEIKYLGGDGYFSGNEINSYPETYIDNIY